MPSGIFFSQENMQTALNLIVQYLRDSGYEGSLEDGTGISDIVLKPSAMLYSLFSQELARAKAYQSIGLAEKLRSEIGETEYDSAVDAALSNWFVTRNAGTPCTGTVRLFFLALPSTIIAFEKAQVVAYTQSYALLASEACAYASSDFSVLMNSAGVDEYYIDVPVFSSVNTPDAPTSGTLLSGAVSHAYFRRATAAMDFTPGEGVESSEDFIRRTRYAITTRELITERAVQTVLPQDYSDIRHIYVARNGSPELLRDLVNLVHRRKDGTVVDLPLHIGNKADIYLATNPAILNEDFLVSFHGTLTNTGSADIPDIVCSEGHAGYIHIFPEAWSCDLRGAPLSEEPDVLLTVDLSSEISAGVSTESLWGSPRLLDGSLNGTGSRVFPGTIRAVYMETGEPLIAGTRVRVQSLSSSLVRTVSNVVQSSDQRVICYDPLVRHKFLIITDISLTIIADKGTDEAALASEATACILSYVRSLASGSGSFTQSEMVSRLHSSVSGIRKIVLPASTSFTVFDPMDSLYKTQTAENASSYFDADKDLPAIRSKQISNNTVQFYTDDRHIHVTVRVE